MADLTPDRLQELRRIAEAATPGPWEVVGLAGYGGPYALRKLRGALQREEPTP